MAKMKAMKAEDGHLSLWHHQYNSDLCYDHRAHLSPAKRIHAGSSMSGSAVSKNGWVLKSSGTKGSTRVGCRLPRNFKHLKQTGTTSAH